MVVAYSGVCLCYYHSKAVFGGLGSNFMNPALAARAMLLTSWPSHMSTFTGTRPDVVASATPLAIMKYGMATDGAASATVEAATSASQGAGGRITYAYGYVRREYSWGL